MINIKNKKNCCGCGACRAVCKHEAISFIVDSEGFWYPKVDIGKCIKCGLCEKVCPFGGKSPSSLHDSTCYVGKNISKTDQLNSSSGGVFPVIAKYILSIGGVVFGASFDGYIVKHSFIDNINDLHKLCGSKYVQSDNFESYREVKNKLNSGKTVLYVGTPCQCLSLKKYLRKEYKNLYMVDIICHGVPSPIIWKSYLSELSQSRNRTINDISNVKFKYKDGLKYKWNHPGFMVEWDKDCVYKEYSDFTSFENGFLTNLFVRPSCHTCKVKRLSSQTNITIGDFWGCEKILPTFFDNNGISVIFVNNNKGMKLFSNIKNNLEIYNIPISDAIRYNSRVIHSSRPHPNRNAFFSSFTKNNYTIDELVKTFSKVGILQKLIFKLRNRFLNILENHTT